MPMNTKYPLLTAWLNGRLREAWISEREALKRNDPKLLPWVLDHEAAARLSAHISMEQEQLETDTRRRTREHRSDSNYSDDLTEFYDALHCNDDLKSFLGILQDISGNRSLIADEIRYTESLHYLPESQLEGI